MSSSKQEKKADLKSPAACGGCSHLRSLACSRPSARTYQTIMGAVYGAMGLATLAFPTRVLRLSLARQHTFALSPALKLMTQCFGAQAAVCGVLLLSTHMSRRAFRIFAAAMLPFFAFDYCAWHYGLISNFGALGDAAGNAIFVTCCWGGWRASEREGATAEIKEID